MQRVKETAFTHADLESVYNSLGLPLVSDDQCDFDMECETEETDPILIFESLRKQANEKYEPDPKSRHSYKTKSPKKMS